MLNKRHTLRPLPVFLNDPGHCYYKGGLAHLSLVSYFVIFIARLPMPLSFGDG